MNDSWIMGYYSIRTNSGDCIEFDIGPTKNWLKMELGYLHASIWYIIYSEFVLLLIFIN
jgi:hypothetical protein